MSGINFLSDNLVDQGSFNITTGAENAQFPISNLLNDSTTNKFRSTGNTVVFEIDLGTNRTIDSIAVVGDSTGSLGITAMTVKTSVTTDFSGSPIYTVDLSSEHNIGYTFITSVSHRYVEVTLTGTGSYAELSNIFLGERINLPQNSLSIGSFKYGNDDRSRVRDNDFGQRFIDVRNKTRFLSGSIEYCTKDETETLDDLFLFHGKTKPLWVFLDPTNTAMNDAEFRLSLYGYLDSIPEWSAAGGQTYTAPLKINEVV